MTNKLITRKLTYCLFALILFPSTLVAQTAESRLRARMSRNDANGDGKLTEAEFDGPQRLFQRLDVDGDGILVIEETVAKIENARSNVADAIETPSKDATTPQRMTARQRLQAMRGNNRRIVEPDYVDVKYGEHERHVFDVYLTETDEPAPCMIWIHGGGFRRGDKSEGALFSRSFTENGIHYVTLNYRLSQHAIAPACFDDCVRALQTIRLNADKWNIDKTRIAIGGGSAGAGLSQWIAFSPDQANPLAEDPVLRESSRVTALVLLNAQTSYDYRWIKQHIPGDAWKGDGLQELFGYDVNRLDEISDQKYELIEEYSPINHLTADDPPMLLFYRRSTDPEIAKANAMDGIHHPIFGTELKKQADRLGVSCQVFSVDSEQEKAIYHRRWELAVEFLHEQFASQN
ncbi:alpha/beta hydrolase fold domain-containing protein [Neorhodopirellula lusitana]|uniref:alpha/beta hydrolase fold domain-containing protein n=1 Tax=Neorhodopirellula lusitana TaxID=445327 RepID=UPI00384A49EF